MRVRMPHGHGGAGENPAEILAVADAMFRGGKPLAKITGVSASGQTAQATFRSSAPIVKAELNYTLDSGAWQQRDWKTVPAQLTAGKVMAQIPAGATAWYINVEDNRGLVVSTEHICPQATK
jgi:hypothetical protein